ncbi:ribonuclease Z [Candidatus Woesearchaeota archaeon]|nr:ribonuclease Z [Candidatus Woesearchaeota archaeon]
MKITFLGVGSATDPNYPNVSVHVEGKKSSIILDCGTSIAQALINRQDIMTTVDGIYISHRHGDHFFGLPTVLMRMRELNRKKPLVIFGHAGIKKFVQAALALAYSTFLGEQPDLPYSLRYAEFEQNKKMFGLGFGLAPTIHGETNYAVRITEGNKSVVYSGDGMFTEQGRKLYRGCDLLIHESFTIDETFRGHAMATDLIKMSKEENVKALALVHFRETVRAGDLARLRTIIKKEKINAFVPEPGTMLVI